MKNPHGVEPTRFMKRKESRWAIKCYPYSGPRFDDDTELLNDFDAIHCDDSIRFKISRYYLKSPSKFLPNTSIVSEQYDDKLREWVGDYKWKMIYRASEHEYTGESFHEYCDNKGPTLIVIKSSGGWIFGGYTTQSWGGSIYIMI